jgi:hypothetical protein
MKSSVFIGSSTEGLEFARAIRQSLDEVAEITLWNEDFIELGDTVVEALTKAVDRFDFAVLVLTPDDLVLSRETTTFGPRDNVIFELGLFMGALGRSRTFMVYQANADVKTPSDLSGVSTARYEWPRRDESYLAAVGSACDQIRRAIRALGPFAPKVGHAIDTIMIRQNTQDAEIRSLRLVLRGLIGTYELQKLVCLKQEGPFMCRYSDGLIEELRRLRAMEFVSNEGRLGLAAITSRYKNTDDEFDLKEYFEITEFGSEYLELRRDLLATAGKESGN